MQKFPFCIFFPRHCIKKIFLSKYLKFTIDKKRHEKNVTDLMFYQMAKKKISLK